MTSQPTFDFTHAVEYIESLLGAPPALAEGLENLAGQRVQPTVGVMAASLLDVLVRTTRPRRVLEIGTSYGFSACVLGRAARTYGGQVITVEQNEVLALAARRNIRAAGLEDTVAVMIADARNAVYEVEGPFGMILQDGGKEDYLPLLDRLVDLLEPGGLLITDDVLFPVMDLPASVDTWKAAVGAYNQAVSKHPMLRTAWLPIGDGVSVSLKYSE